MFSYTFHGPSCQGTYLGGWCRVTLYLDSKLLGSTLQCSFESLSHEHQIRTMNEEDMFAHLTGRLGGVLNG